MPILPPSGNAPLDNLTTVLNAARVKMQQKDLQTLQPMSGQILDWTQPGTQQAVNSAWRKLQQYAGSIGHTQLKQEAIISAIPAITTFDPAIIEQINWTFFFDGTNNLTSPYLPFDMLLPIKVWERPNGQETLWSPMELMFDGLRLGRKQTFNGQWEWRAASINFPGALQVLDMRLLYVRNLGDFSDDGVTPWFSAQVPLNDSLEAFSTFICAEVAASAADKVAWTQAAHFAVKEMVNRELGMKQRQNIRRQSRSGRLEGFGGCGGFGW